MRNNISLRMSSGLDHDLQGQDICVFKNEWLLNNQESLSNSRKIKTVLSFRFTCVACKYTTRFVRHRANKVQVSAFDARVENKLI